MNIKYLGILEKYIDTYYYSTMLKNSSFWWRSMRSGLINNILKLELLTVCERKKKYIHKCPLRKDARLHYYVEKSKRS